MSELRRLIPLCRNQNPELVLSHGDIPGNVMIRSHDDLTVIDWDELILAPVERDIWMTRHHDDFRKGYATSRPTPISTRICVLFIYISITSAQWHIFLADIFSDRDLEYRKNILMT
jgi:thiamine kinase-like enzyme